MSLSLVLSPMEFMVEDQPYLREGKIIDDKKGEIGSSDLLFVTLRGTDQTNSTLLRESKVELFTNYFDFKFAEPITRFQFGSIWARGFWKETTSITLNGGISDSDTTANLTVTSGTVGESGYALIEDEVCSFTKLTATSIQLGRGAFETTAASHSSGVTVGFSISSETCLNRYNIEFETQDRELFRFQNFRFRGQ